MVSQEVYSLEYCLVSYCRRAPFKARVFLCGKKRKRTEPFDCFQYAGFKVLTFSVQRRFSFKCALNWLDNAGNNFGMRRCVCLLLFLREYMVVFCLLNKSALVEAGVLEEPSCVV